MADIRQDTMENYDADVRKWVVAVLADSEEFMCS